MDRSVLARKPMTELKDIASHLQMRGFQKLRKADLIEAIISHATADAGGNGAEQASDVTGEDTSSAPADDAGRSRTRTRTRERSDDDAATAEREETARKVLPPTERNGSAAEKSGDGDAGGGRRRSRGPAGADGSGSTSGGSAEAGSDDTGSSRGRQRNRSGGAADAGDGQRSDGRASDGNGRSNGGGSRSSRAGGTGSDRAGSDRAGSDKDDSDRADSDRAGSGRAGSDRGGSDTDGSDTDGADQGSSNKRESAKAGSGGGGSDDGDTASQDTSGQDTDDDGDESASSRKRRNRRDRRKRNRERNEQETQQDNQPGEVRAGVLDILPEGYGFLRTTGYLPGDRDVYVSQGQIRKHALRRGDVVQGPIRQQRNNEKVPALHHVQKVNGDELVNGQVAERTDFADLVPVYPSEQLRLETAKGPIVLRAIDLLAPIGKGQRALLVAPPAAGRTDTITGIGQAISDNNPDVHLMVLLIDERPEDVTEVQRALPGEVIASTFNRPVEDHTQIAELALERAKRMVELGHDVVILLDSLTRLARAYGGGGVDAASLFPAKRFFGAARNVEDGGSLTIVAASLVGTGSAIDQTIHDEFIGTANAIITLQGELEPHLRPAVDVGASSTRRDELLVEGEELQALWAMRRRMEGLTPAEAAASFADKIAETSSNDSFLDDLQKADAS